MERKIIQIKIKEWKERLEEKRKTFFHDENRMSKQTLFTWLFFIGIYIYYELIFHLLNFNSLEKTMIYPIMFAITIGTFLTGFVHLFRGKGRQIVLWFIVSLTSLLFLVQLIYSHVFKVLFSFQIVGMAGDAFTEFGGDILTALKENVGGILFFMVPLVVLRFLMPHLQNTTEKEEMIKLQKKEGIVIVIGIVITYIIAILSLNITGRGDYTPYDLYYNSRVHDLCGKQLGIMTMTRFDLLNMVRGGDDIIMVDGDSLIVDVDVDEDVDNGSQTKEPQPIPEKQQKEPTEVAEIVITPEPIDTSPNKLIDFAELLKEEENESIRALHEYFERVTPTNKNEYTGMFEGYNLILITAEGFSPYAVHPTKTPTLNRLVNDGFSFTNFYTPLWQTSTSDGEYIIQTGLIPVGTRSMYRSRNNDLPFVLGNQFKNMGITTKAYHNHTYTYYQRDETHPNLGYDYKGVGNGLELEHITWPNSDVEMIQSSTQEFVNETPFHVYYLTVSGHMNYTFMGNTISSKNKELVADLPYSSDVKAYIACQMELDMALEELIRDLEEAGIADHTVIALTADHYPYGWEKQYLDEIAGQEVDPNFDVFRNHLILWTPSMEEKVVVDKPCSSLDILPTLSNLFALPYDSRLLMGQDILSDSSPLVILNNRSFITDKVKYNAETREIISLTEEQLPDNYIDIMNQIVKNKFIVSESILNKNYYKYILSSINR